MAMFGGEEKMEQAAETIVGLDVTIKGNFKSPSNIVVNGTVKGKVDTKACVEVGEQALIEGSVSAKKVTVSGAIQGNVEGSESIEITPTGKIYGDISTSNLIIQSGATFVGKSTMFEKETEEAKAQDFEKGETEETQEMPSETTEDREREEVTQ